MTSCFVSIFNKLIDDQGHLDMRNVTTLIWVNRKKPQIVEAIVELLIEVPNNYQMSNINRKKDRLLLCFFLHYELCYSLPCVVVVATVVVPFGVIFLLKTLFLHL